MEQPENNSISSYWANKLGILEGEMKGIVKHVESISKHTEIMSNNVQTFINGTGTKFSEGSLTFQDHGVRLEGLEDRNTKKDKFWGGIRFKIFATMAGIITTAVLVAIASVWFTK